MMMPKTMARLLAKPAVRFAADAVTGFGVFFGLSFAFQGAAASGSMFGMEAQAAGWNAGGAALAFLPSAPLTVGAGNSHMAFFMLAAVFSTLFALNFAFARHLRKAHILARRAKRRAAARTAVEDQTSTH